MVAPGKELLKLMATAYWRASRVPGTVLSSLHSRFYLIPMVPWVGFYCHPHFISAETKTGWAPATSQMAGYFVAAWRSEPGPGDLEWDPRSWLKEVMFWLSLRDRVWRWNGTKDLAGEIARANTGEKGHRVCFGTWEPSSIRNACPQSSPSQSS